MTRHILEHPPDLLSVTAGKITTCYQVRQNSAGTCDLLDARQWLVVDCYRANN